MKEPNAPPRYGEALLNVAEKQQAVQDVVDGSRLVTSVIRQRPQLTVFLNMPQVAAGGKKAMIHKVFENQVHPVLVDFLCLLVDRQRTDNLLDIFEAFEHAWDRRRGVHPVEVRTAVRMPEDLQASMQQRLEAMCGGKVRVNWVVDPTIIGGVVVLVGDTGTDIDGSIRRQLQLIREALLQAKVY